MRHAFEPHTHEAFGLGAIESGVERFRYRGEDHLAPADTLVLMNPDELHTGRAETNAGWRYRMAYIDAPVLEELSGERGWWFAEAVACAPDDGALHNWLGIAALAMGDLGDALPAFDAAIERGCALAHTNRIAEAGRLLGIVVHDHVIIGKEGHASLKAKGLI